MMPLFDLRIAIRNNPWVLKTAWQNRRWVPSMNKHPGRRVVELGDDAVIDAYPRSANTFACDTFVANQDRPVQIGNHFHSPAQFFLARKYKVPAMLVLREPVAAALSWVVFNEGSYDAEKALRFYILFHRPLHRIADSFVVAPFEEVTSDFGRSVERLNARFGTDFNAATPTKETEQQIFAAMENRLRKREAQQGRDLKLRMNFPHADKEKRRREIAEIFEAPALDGIKADARGHYEALLAQGRA